MDSLKLSKNFYLAALNYYMVYSAVESSDDFFYNPNLIYPIAFLGRHTLELFLKAALLFNVPRQEVNKNMIIKGNKNQDYKFGMHSLKDLLNRVIEESSTNKLFSEFSGFEKELDIIEEYDKNDKNGETYRYPFSQDGNLNEIKFVDNINYEIAVDISEINNYYVFEKCINNKNIKYLVRIKDKKVFKYYQILKHLLMKFKPIVECYFIEK